MPGSDSRDLSAVGPRDPAATKGEHMTQVQRVDKTDHVAMGPGLENTGAQKMTAGATEPRQDHSELPPTLELKRYGYLASARGLNGSSGAFDGANATGLVSQASSTFEFNLGRQSSQCFVTGIGDGDRRSFRQSSIDSEPQTLNIITVRQAKDGAVEIIETYDEEEAVHLFLKDAEDEHLREEALAAILPISGLETEEPHQR